MDPHTSMPYPAAAIANEFIKLSREANRPVSPMKLQKLVYFAHGWYLALTGKPLINEPVEAWKFGPVIPSLYHVLKSYGDKEISNYLTDDPWNSLALMGQAFKGRTYLIQDGPDPQENDLAKQVVRRIWDVYGGFNAVQLSNLTHAEDAPWTRTSDKDKKHTIINQEAIRDYFAHFLQQNRERHEALQNAR